MNGSDFNQKRKISFSWGIEMEGNANVASFFPNYPFIGSVQISSKHTKRNFDFLCLLLTTFLYLLFLPFSS